MENNLPSRLKTAHIKSTTDFETDADKLKNYILNAKTLMSYYRCAILEVETKFKVLDDSFHFVMREIRLKVSAHG